MMLMLLMSTTDDSHNVIITPCCPVVIALLSRDYSFTALSYRLSITLMNEHSRCQIESGTLTKSSSSSACSSVCDIRNCVSNSVKQPQFVDSAETIGPPSTSPLPWIPCFILTRALLTSCDQFCWQKFNDHTDDRFTVLRISHTSLCLIISINVIN